MGLGIYLSGDCERASAKWLADVQTFVASHQPDVYLASEVSEGENGEPALYLSLHPAEEPVELALSGPKKVRLSARTSGAGPGYHQWLCDLLDALAAQFGIRWQGEDPTGETGDETDYFYRRDRKELEHEMRLWLRTVGRQLKESGADLRFASVSLPVNGPQYDTIGAATALGPRALDFWNKVDTDDRLAASFFPWWEHGVGCGYFLGRALTRMWLDVRWRDPLSAVEAGVHAEVIALLDKAFAIDKKRDYPFTEWSELRSFGELADEISLKGKPGAGGRIGYRRNPVRVRPYRRWSVRIPGSLAESFGEDGTWSAWDSSRTLQLTPLSMEPDKPGAKLPPFAKGGDKELARDDALLDGKATLVALEEEGEKFFRLSGELRAKKGPLLSMLLVSVVFTSEEDRAWAIETWRSVELPE